MLTAQMAFKIPIRVYPPDSALWRDDCEEPVRELSVSGSSIVSWNSSRSSAV